MSSASKSTPTTAAASGSSSSSSTSAAAASASSNVQEFKIRVPKMRKKHHVMRFNATLNVDFAQWRNVKLERENNMKEFRGMDEDQPKFGAGSEYNRDQREEARRKKFGIIARKYRPEAQPWILKVGGKMGKKFKGIREGGVGENAAFYVFTHAPDGAIEAYPLTEWYNFQPIQRYKSLSAEEAEQEFGRRKKVMNYFSLMLRKRLRGDEEEEQDPEEAKLLKAATKKSKELKITDMDEWIDSEDESDSEDEEEKKKKEQEDSDDGSKKAKGGKGKKGADKKKKKRDVDDEAFEESDDGDEEGREMDYDTESSEDEPDPESKLDKDMKGVAEEDALRKLLTSDEEDEDEKKSDESDKDEADGEKKKKEKNKDEASKDKKKKKPSKDDKKSKANGSGGDSSTDFSTDSTDSEDDLSNGPPKKKVATKDKEKEKEKDKESASSSNKPSTSSNANKSRSSTPTPANNDASKRKMNSLPSDLTGSDTSNSPTSTPAKRTKNEISTSLPTSFSGSKVEDYGITEEAVRRYLKRKPLTATELLTKFKNKKTGVSSDRLVETMTKILKKINPVKHTIQGKMYLWIK
ncbi:general transcription factor IIF subunit 1 [Drosophila obscura]|uniref:general transcription factor IIF subunit 1 n=1 Tax=Drosophila obscura TaxID=7282 RepID=UPI000BA08617|nr:general transcription factor IIF subunit 1 [Drosophila obscura]